MTLYTKQGRSYRPATEPEILSAYGALMAARRKSNASGHGAPLRFPGCRCTTVRRVADRDA